MTLDQHFMIDKDLLKEIADSADLLPTDTILEIGAGHGELTKFLSGKCEVIAIESDPTLAEELKNKAFANTRIIEGNVLKLWKKLSFSKVIGNIPYSISEPLLWLILKKPLERIVLVVGKDFSDILLGNEKLGTLAKEFYSIERLKTIPKKAFFPAPRVDSALLVFAPKPPSNQIIRELVWQSDKKIKNALEAALERDHTKREVKEKLEPLGKLVDKKITQLSNDEFAKIHSWLNGIRA